MVPCCCYVDVFCNGYSSAVLWLLFKSYSTDPELENGGKMAFSAMNYEEYIGCVIECENASIDCGFCLPRKYGPLLLLC